MTSQITSENLDAAQVKGLLATLAQHAPAQEALLRLLGKAQGQGEPLHIKPRFKNVGGITAYTGPDLLTLDFHGVDGLKLEHIQAALGKPLTPPTGPDRMRSVIYRYVEGPYPCRLVIKWPQRVQASDREPKEFTIQCTYDRS